MGIAAKHAYRFQFLNSETWNNLRVARLARDGAKCRLCGKRDLSNDVHHIFYPEKWEDTAIQHLKTLCRECHEKVHIIQSDNPTFTWKQIKNKIKPPKIPGWQRAAYHAKKRTIDSSMIVS